MAKIGAPKGTVPWNAGKGTIIECVICNEKVYVKPSQVGRRKCCSKVCRHIWQRTAIRGQKNGRWNGGRFFKKDLGYYMVRVGKKYKYEHVLVWEKHKGTIPEGNVIHHKNGNRKDNRIENLACVTPSVHAKIHYRQGDFPVKNNPNIQ